MCGIFPSALEYVLTALPCCTSFSPWHSFWIHPSLRVSNCVAVGILSHHPLKEKVHRKTVKGTLVSSLHCLLPRWTPTYLPDITWLYRTSHTTNITTISLLHEHSNLCKSYIFNGIVTVIVSLPPSRITWRVSLEKSSVHVFAFFYPTCAWADLSL